jgi:hypothetical protein
MVASIRLGRSSGYAWAFAEAIVAEAAVRNQATAARL